MNLIEAEELVMENGHGQKEFEEEDFENPEFKEALNVLIANGYKILKTDNKILFK